MIEISSKKFWDVTRFKKHVTSSQSYFRYVGRKRLVKSESPVEGSKFLLHAAYSYWTLGYILSESGARKLIGAMPLGKLVPVDEYLPILSDTHPKYAWNDYCSQFEGWVDDRLNQFKKKKKNQKETNARKWNKPCAMQNRTFWKSQSISYYPSLRRLLYSYCYFDREQWAAQFPIRDLIILSTNPLLIYPTHYTGEDGHISDTEDSKLVQNTVTSIKSGNQYDELWLIWR